VSTRTDTGVEDYLTQLRQELADLPAEEVDEIVEDLEPQLTEIAALGDGLSAAALADRLGTPAEYARELRSAAGLDEPGGRRPSTWLPRTVLGVLTAGTIALGYGGYLSGRLASSDARYVLPFFGLALAVAAFEATRRRPAMTEVAALPELRWASSLLTSRENARRAVGYLVSLRPGWFLAKTVLVWLGVLWLFRGLGWWDAWPEVNATIAAAITLAASHRTVTDRRWLWLSVPLTGWAIGVAVKMTDLLPQILSGDHIGL
jgi:hypothetical protein